MIRFDGVTVTYPDAPGPALRDVHLDVPEGELALVVGRTGAGKSTLLGAVNGLVPHFTGGRLAGRVLVEGRDTRTHPPRELADVVGVVGQDPLAGFVTDTVEEELAYGMEQLAVPPATMRRRVEEVLDLLGLADVRRRALTDLSGGQQQRVAIGAVLTAHPRVLVLDEPTSALDPTAAEDVLAAVTRLVHDLGTTVLLAEHRLERVVQYADRLVHVAADGTVTDGDPARLLAASEVAPPVVELGRLAGWQPLPLSVRDARRRAGDLRERLKSAVTAVPPPGGAEGTTASGGPLMPGGIVLAARGVVVRYGDVVAVRGVDVDLRAGQVVALMGRNGSGKSSLLWAAQGSGRRDGGSVRVGTDPSGTGAGGSSAGGRNPGGRNAGGTDPGAVSPARARALVGLVPQTPADLLYLEKVAEELARADEESGAPPGTADALLRRLSPGVPRDAHPRDVSEGQRLALVLAVQLVAAPAVVLLDEPTRGLDYGAKERLSAVLRELAAEGRAVVVSTHDVEFVAAAADRVVVLAEGEVVADGATADVVRASPAYAPQVAKVLAPLPLLTVAEVAAALPAPTGDGAR